METSKSATAAAQCCRRYVFALVITTLLMSTAARPRESADKNLRGLYCTLNEVQQETCQKCAKLTKSRYVYPMCCNEEEGVYKWCMDYINYGQHDV